MPTPTLIWQRNFEKHIEDTKRYLHANTYNHNHIKSLTIEEKVMTYEKVSMIL